MLAPASFPVTVTETVCRPICKTKIEIRSKTANGVIFNVAYLLNLYFSIEERLGGFFVACNLFERGLGLFAICVNGIAYGQFASATASSLTSVFVCIFRF